MEQYTQGSYGMTPTKDGDFVKYQDYKEAMAKKDRELELADFTIKECLEKLSQQDKALAEKDREIAHLKEKVAHYDRWLSKGVYYTNDEFFEKILKPKQQLMEQAVRFAQIITDAKEATYGGAEEAHLVSSQYREAQAFLKEREGA